VISSDPGVPVAQNTHRRREHGHPQTGANGLDVLRREVDPPPGLAHATEPFDHQAPVVLVAELDGQDRLLLVPADLDSPDESLGAQHVGDRQLQLRRRAAHASMTRPTRIADSRQHVTHRIGHHGVVFLPADSLGPITRNPAY